MHTHYMYVHTLSAVDAITLAFRPPGPHQYSTHVLFYVHTIQN